jgi:hypothetical protein
MGGLPRAWCLRARPGAHAATIKILALRRGGELCSAVQATERTSMGGAKKHTRRQRQFWRASGTHQPKEGIHRSAMYPSPQRFRLPKPLNRRRIEFRVWLVSRLMRPRWAVQGCCVEQPNSRTCAGQDSGLLHSSRLASDRGLGVSSQEVWTPSPRFSHFLSPPRARTSRWKRSSRAFPTSRDCRAPCAGPALGASV